MSYDASITVWIDDGDNGKAAIQTFVDYTNNDDNDTYWGIDAYDDDTALAFGQSFETDAVAAVLAPIAEKHGVTFGVWYKNDFDNECTVHVGSKASVYMLKDSYEKAADALRELERAIKSHAASVNEAVALLDKRDADTLSRYSVKPDFME